MSKEKFNDKGFILIETVFFAMILSFTALLIMNGLQTAIKSEKISAIRTEAIYLAMARMAEIEECNYQSTSFQLPSSTFLTDEDLIYENFFGINGTLKFNLETKINNSNAKYATVIIKVTWTVDDKEYGINNDNNYEEITKDIWLSPTT